MVPDLIPVKVVMHDGLKLILIVLGQDACVCIPFGPRVAKMVCTDRCAGAGLPVELGSFG